MVNYNLKYKTFDSLLADVMTDFKMYSQENMIDPQELIRVAKWVTKDLGLKVYKTKETVVELQYGKAKLPDDFYVFNFGLLCGQVTQNAVLPQGTTMKEIPYPAPLYQEQPASVIPCDESCPTETTCDNAIVDMPGYNPLKPTGDSCVKPRVFMDCKGNNFELIQIISSTQSRTWKYMLPLRLINNSSVISCYCPNLSCRTPNEIWIENGFIFSNLQCGELYINYEGSLEDEEGNLLIPEHEKLTLFYEYKLKDRILENLYNNGEDVVQKLDRNAARLRTARIEAKTLVAMVDFTDMQEMYELNRKAFNARYVNMFKTCNWF